MSRDTPVTPYARPPVSTDSGKQRPVTRLPQSTAICRSATFCHILPTYFHRNIYNIRNVRNFCRILLSLPNSTKFC